MHKNSIIILKLLGVLAFVFIANEIAGRWFVPAPEKMVTAFNPGAPAPAKKHAGKSPSGQRMHLNRTITIENHHLSKKKVVIERNGIGYRNREITAKPRQPGYKRILFLGDSIVFQDFLNEEETFVRLVETKARKDNKPWETINAAVGGISLKTELDILQTTGLSLAPDVVVLNFYLNDFQESKVVRPIKLPAWLARSQFLTQVTTILSTQKNPRSQSDLPGGSETLEKWRADFEKSHPITNGVFNKSPETFNALVRNRFNSFGVAWSPDAWAYLEPSFARLQRLSVENNFKPVIVFHPTYFQVYSAFIDDYPQQQLKRIAGNLGIPVLDLLPPLRAEALRIGGPAVYQGNELHREMFYDECHHTEAATVFVADQIYSFLSKL